MYGHLLFTNFLPLCVLFCIARWTSFFTLLLPLQRTYPISGIPHPSQFPNSQPESCYNPSTLHCAVRRVHICCPEIKIDYTNRSTWNRPQEFLNWCRVCWSQAITARTYTPVAQTINTVLNIILKLDHATVKREKQKVIRDWYRTLPLQLDPNLKLCPNVRTWKHLFGETTLQQSIFAVTLRQPHKSTRLVRNAGAYECHKIAIGLYLIFNFITQI